MSKITKKSLLVTAVVFMLFAALSHAVYRHRLLYNAYVQFRNELGFVDDYNEDFKWLGFNIGQTRHDVSELLKDNATLSFAGHEADGAGIDFSFIKFDYYKFNHAHSAEVFSSRFSEVFCFFYDVDGRIVAIMRSVSDWPSFFGPTYWVEWRGRGGQANQGTMSSPD